MRSPTIACYYKVAMVPSFLKKYDIVIGCMGERTQPCNDLIGKIFVMGVEAATHIIERRMVLHQQSACCIAKPCIAKRYPQKALW